MPRIHISGDIGWYPNRAEYLRATIEDSPAGEDVIVTIDSLGGDAFEGMAIYSLLKNCGRKVVTQIGSVAASSASLIFLGGSERIMPEGTLYMIHKIVFGGGGGSDSEDLRKTADIMDKLSGEYAKIYAAETGMSADKIAELMAAETWLDSAEATRLGFATTQAAYDAAGKLNARTRILRFAADATARFVNAPVSVFKPQHKPAAMNKELLAKLGLAADATPEQIESAVAALHADAVKLRAEATTTEEKRKSDAEVALNAEADAIVTEAINAGALAEADRAPTVRAYKADKAGTKALVAKLIAAAKGAKPDGHGAPLKLSAQGEKFSAEAFAAGVAAADDGEARAALYREFPAMQPKGATKLVAFAKANPKTYAALQGAK